ncbi:MAG: FAD-dependent oxidoreductase, partial [Desulfamplus sp.]|nr:FAD-dependent oxidoreductase [Desulfamplus sp.]
MSIDSLADNWDMVVVGGGITGAGIFREAVRMGLKTLLLEQRDFAWGTSGRSSKMVHGGLRYLKQGKLLLTRNSVMERQRLVKEAPGLVEPLEFLTPVYKNQSPGCLMMGAGLTIYSALAGSFQYKYYPKNAFLKRVPSMRSENLTGGYGFWDAGVDDARLVLRLIKDGQASGGTALNYTKVNEVLRNPENIIENREKDIENSEIIIKKPESMFKLEKKIENKGFVSGVLIQDFFTKKTKIVQTPVVIN